VLSATLDWDVGHSRHVDRRRFRCADRRSWTSHGACSEVGPVLTLGFEGFRTDAALTRGSLRCADQAASGAEHGAANQGAEELDSPIRHGDTTQCLTSRGDHSKTWVGC